MYRKLKNNEFKILVQEINPLLDFTNTEYLNYSTKVNYKCLKHGLRSSYPCTLLKGSGCAKCGQRKAADSVKLTTFDFIRKGKSIHGDKYNYDKVNYVGSLKKVLLKCNVCDTEFNQMAHTHFKNDGGCPVCKKLKLKLINSENPLCWGFSKWKIAAEKSKRFESYKVYIIECYSENERFIKIGRTFCSIDIRFNGKGNMPYKYNVLKTFIFNNAKEAFDLENKLKKIYKIYKYTPKIFFKGIQECFNIGIKINLI